MGSSGLGRRRAVCVAASGALHGAAAAAFLLAGKPAPPDWAPEPIAVGLAMSSAGSADEPPAPVMSPPPESAVPPPPLPVPAPQPVRTEAPQHRPAPRRVAIRAPVPAAPAATVATAVAMPGPAAAAPVSAGPSAAWLRALDAWIDAHLDYPEESRRRGEQGAVLVRFTVARDGSLLDFALLRGSGCDDLDDATRAMFRHARLPAAPLETDPVQATLTKPVRYVLK
jgi:protein TonB